MTLTARDRKILLALVPLVIIGAYWFLLLAPKRAESAKVQEELTQAQGERDTAVQKLQGLDAAKDSYARDYATVIYLGKSIPSAVDMPSLMVQLDRASRGTGIKFTSIKTGDRTDAGSTPAAPAPADAKQAAGSSPAAGSAAAATTNPTLDTVPLDFQFDGSFFDLTDFFHRMKRFVRVANNNHILVRGRLLTVNAFTFAPAQEGFPHLTATVHATVYLAPKSEGTTAGATPDGPAGAQPPTGQSASTSSTPPAATVLAR